MKFIHLGDLHIGKRVNEFSMINDQREILKQIIKVSKSEKVNGIFIAEIFTTKQFHQLRQSSCLKILSVKLLI